MIHAFSPSSSGCRDIAASIRDGFLFGIGLTCLSMAMDHWGGKDVYYTVVAGLAMATTIRSGHLAQRAGHLFDKRLYVIGSLSLMGALGLGVQVLVTP